MSKMVQCDTQQMSSKFAVNRVSETARAVLLDAQQEDRIVLGFSDAIKHLSKTPEDAVFCFLAEPKRGDSATHMHEVLLQAFCYEHDIYIIKVDCALKLGHLMGLHRDETCVLVRKMPELKPIRTVLTASPANDEEVLINFYKRCWNDSKHSIVALPES